MTYPQQIKTLTAILTKIKFALNAQPEPILTLYREDVFRLMLTVNCGLIMEYVLIVTMVTLFSIKGNVD